jgi:hypothetical protein
MMPDWLSNMLSGLIGAIIGSLVGFGMVKFDHHLESKGERTRNEERLTSWLRALQANLNNLISDLDEALPNVQQMDVRRLFAKRLTLGFIEEAVVHWCEIDNDSEFFQLLSQVFANCRHTNNMMDRLEVSSVNSNGLETNKMSVVNAIGVTRETTSALKGRVALKLQGSQPTN